ncbi:MAG: YjbQ family protein [Chloroflexi bacterium]|nr:MAG: YjbQ family protein [Chloroflexota bacterium]
MTKWFQRELVLAPKPRGFHLITGEIVSQLPELGRLRVGLAHIFILHTSASLAVNENADPTVRHDLEAHFNRMAPENAPYYRHVLEGADDMPAHIKAVLVGSSVTVPVRNGRFYLGTWQGIYLCEHRNSGGPRHLVVTLHGEMSD